MMRAFTRETDGLPAIQRARAEGAAICPRCLAVHYEAGWEHLDGGPWSLTPRCKYPACGTVLIMPWKEGNEP